jgi:hypothetical protein
MVHYCRRRTAFVVQMGRSAPLVNHSMRVAAALSGPGKRGTKKCRATFGSQDSAGTSCHTRCANQRYVAAVATSAIDAAAANHTPTPTACPNNEG